MDRLGDRMGDYYSSWLATSISCCIARSREQPQSTAGEGQDEEKTLTMDREIAAVPARATTVKRQSPIPGETYPCRQESCCSDANPVKVSKYNVSSVCYQQPPRRSQPSWPDFDAEDPSVQLPRPVSSRHNQPTWPDRRQSLHSKASQRVRSKSGKSSRRPTISAPTDFRKSDASSFEFLIHGLEPPRAVSPIPRRLSPFRPLQLSIYIPGNELPALPKFSDDDDVDDDLPPVSGIERPQQALLTKRSEPIMGRRLSSFSIPRKPVGSSRANSMELAQAPRTSIDSGLTLNNNDASVSSHKQSNSIERLHSDHRPSISATKSAQEFLEIINAPLPPLPQPTSTSHQTAGSYAPKTIYRSASDQNLRLQTHLEERSATIQAWETISEKEERSPVSPLTPPQPQITAFATSTTSRNSQIFVQRFVQQRSNTTGHPTWTDPNFEFPAPPLRKARSSSGSSTLFNEKALEAGFPPARTIETSPPHTTTSVTATVTVRPTTPRISTRLSAWLARSIASMQQASAQDALVEPTAVRNSNYSGRSRNSNLAWENWEQVSYPAPLTIGAGAVSLPGEVKKAKSAPAAGAKSKPLVGMGHARGQSSVSTYVASAGVEEEVVDMEKLPVVVTERSVGAVGVAF